MASVEPDVTRWAALLRGVNVGGITIRNAELSELFAGLGARAVRTVLASGNVCFEADAAADRAHLKVRIEQALRDRFGYDAWIVLVTAEELRATVDAFPFDDADAARQPYVVFCPDDAVRAELLQAAASADGDADPVRAGEGVVYWSPRVGTTLTAPFGRILGRARYRSWTTTRNLRTLQKMIR
ncbi:DUF1697 domain-containing protein [Microbacterium elymi]|uniref:DUF1697 domain-containing protein n=1 Tax=Microbacterium elymi TaxID=2909587 RepID=A0ABY5NJP6_9MICO|nr:DUF1697 domain-containing protein [Microbacterium elymi]UUT35387.1 DUF1697 domain-containing protein [Microbacterium elymi]